MKQPNNVTIKKWMNAELSGQELDSVQNWADNHPELAEKLISQLETSEDDALVALPKEIEPPFADFLNSKIRQSIEAEERDPQSLEVAQPAQSIWSKLQMLFIPTALAAMATCFLLGMQYGKKGEAKQPIAEEKINMEAPAFVYVPEEAVSFDTFDTGEESFIVLEGLEPFSDDDITILSPDKKELSVRFVSREQRDMGWF